MAVEDLYELWRSGEGMARAIARRNLSWAPRGSAEDLFQAAMTGLWRAALNWRADLGEFLPYARQYVHGEVVEEVWRQQFWGSWAGRKVWEGQWEEPPRRAAWNSTSSENGVWQSRIPRVGPDTSLDDRDLLEWVVGQLRPWRVKLVARMYWLDGLSSAEVARHTAFSVSMVQKLHREAFDQMQAKASALKRMWER